VICLLRLWRRLLDVTRPAVDDSCSCRQSHHRLHARIHDLQADVSALHERNTSLNGQVRRLRDTDAPRSIP
jgi:hypothetical protein